MSGTERRLTHADESGKAKMVDVGDKAPTSRRATAQGRVRLTAEAFAAVRDNALAKGDALGIARLAGIQGAKETSRLIPLCHQLPLSHVEVNFELDEPSFSVIITATARTEARTGVDIPFIFEKEGEEGFRIREVKVIDELSQMDGVVLATGGGAIADADSRNRLGARGYVIYLYTSVKQQLERTQRGRNRPMLDTGDPEQVLEELMAVRDPLYREIADLIVDTDGRRVQTVAREIHESL